MRDLSSSQIFYIKDLLTSVHRENYKFQREIEHLFCTYVQAKNSIFIFNDN